MVTKEKVTHFLSLQSQDNDDYSDFICECDESTVEDRIREKTYAFIVDAIPDHSHDVLVILKSTGDVYYAAGLAGMAGTKEKFYELLGDKKPLARIKDRG